MEKERESRRDGEEGKKLREQEREGWRRTERGRKRRT